MKNKPESTADEQALLELLYDVLPEAEAEKWQAKISSDPRLARRYADLWFASRELQQACALPGLTVRLPELTTLPEPTAEEAAEIAASQQIAAQQVEGQQIAAQQDAAQHVAEPQADKRHLAAAKPRSSDMLRLANWIISLAAILLLMVTGFGIVARSRAPLDHSLAMRLPDGPLVLAGATHLNPAAAAEFEMRSRAPAAGSSSPGYVAQVTDSQNQVAWQEDISPDAQGRSQIRIPDEVLQRLAAAPTSQAAEHRQARLRVFPRHQLVEPSFSRYTQDEQIRPQVEASDTASPPAVPEDASQVVSLPLLVENASAGQMRLWLSGRTYQPGDQLQFFAEVPHGEGDPASTAGASAASGVVIHDAQGNLITAVLPQQVGPGVLTGAWEIPSNLPAGEYSCSLLPANDSQVPLAKAVFRVPMPEWSRPVAAPNGGGPDKNLAVLAPDEGQLISGEENRVFALLVDTQGIPLDGPALIANEQGTSVCEFQVSHGLGEARFVPEPNQGYSVMPAHREWASPPLMAQAAESSWNWRCDSSVLPANTPLSVTVRRPSGSAQVAPSPFAPEALLLITQDNNPIASRTMFAEEAGQKLEIGLPADVSGLLRVELYNMTVSPPARIGERLIFKQPAEYLQVATAPDFSGDFSQQQSLPLLVSAAGSQPESPTAFLQMDSPAPAAFQFAEHASPEPMAVARSGMHPLKASGSSSRLSAMGLNTFVALASGDASAAARLEALLAVINSEPLDQATLGDLFAAPLAAIVPGGKMLLAGAHQTAGKPQVATAVPHAPVGQPSQATGFFGQFSWETWTRIALLGSAALIGLCLVFGAISARTNFRPWAPALTASLATLVFAVTFYPRANRKGGDDAPTVAWEDPQPKTRTSNAATDSLQAAPNSGDSARMDRQLPDQGGAAQDQNGGPSSGVTGRGSSPETDLWPETQLQSGGETAETESLKPGEPFAKTHAETGSGAGLAVSDESLSDAAPPGAAPPEVALSDMDGPRQAGLRGADSAQLMRLLEEQNVLPQDNWFFDWQRANLGERSAKGLSLSVADAGLDAAFHYRSLRTGEFDTDAFGKLAGLDQERLRAMFPFHTVPPWDSTGSDGTYRESTLHEADNAPAMESEEPLNRDGGPGGPPNRSLETRNRDPGPKQGSGGPGGSGGGGPPPDNAGQAEESNSAGRPDAPQDPGAHGIADASPPIDAADVTRSMPAAGGLGQPTEQMSDPPRPRFAGGSGAATESLFAEEAGAPGDPASAPGDPAGGVAEAENAAAARTWAISNSINGVEFNFANSNSTACQLPELPQPQSGEATILVKDAQGRFGLAKVHVARRPPFSVQWSPPAELTQGDYCKVPVTLTNTGMADAVMRLELACPTGLQPEADAPVEMLVPAGQSATLQLPVSAHEVLDGAALELKVTAGNCTATATQTVSVGSTGFPVYGCASGVADGTVQHELLLPEDASQVYFGCVGLPGVVPEVQAALASQGWQACPNDEQSEFASRLVHIVEASQARGLPMEPAWEARFKSLADMVRKSDLIPEVLLSAQTSGQGPPANQEGRLFDSQRLQELSANQDPLGCVTGPPELLESLQSSAAVLGRDLDQEPVAHSDVAGLGDQPKPAGTEPGPGEAPAGTEAPSEGPAPEGQPQEAFATEQAHVSPTELTPAQLYASYLDVNLTALAVQAWDAEQTFAPQQAQAVDYLQTRRTGLAEFGNLDATVQALEALSRHGGDWVQSPGMLQLHVRGEPAAAVALEAQSERAISAGNLAAALLPGQNSVQLQVTGEGNRLPYLLELNYRVPHMPARQIPVLLETKLSNDVAVRGQSLAYSVRLKNEALPGSPEANEFIAAGGMVVELHLPGGLRFVPRSLPAEEARWYRVVGQTLYVGLPALAAEETWERTYLVQAENNGRFMGQPSAVYMERNLQRKSWSPPLAIEIADEFQALPAPAAPE